MYMKKSRNYHFNVSVYTVNVPVNDFQSCGDDFLPTYLTNTKKRIIKCLAQGHKTATSIGTLRSPALF